MSVSFSSPHPAIFSLSSYSIMASPSSSATATGPKLKSYASVLSSSPVNTHPSPSARASAPAASLSHPHPSPSRGPLAAPPSPAAASSSYSPAVASLPGSPLTEDQINDLICNAYVAGWKQHFTNLDAFIFLLDRAPSIANSVLSGESRQEVEKFLKTSDGPETTRTCGGFVVTAVKVLEDAGVVASVSYLHSGRHGMAMVGLNGEDQ